MQFSNEIQEKINALYEGFDKGGLMKVQKDLTSRYKSDSGTSENLIKSKEDSVIYAISRMPATYSVTSTLLSQLAREGLLGGTLKVADIGSGTGAGYLAIKTTFEGADVQLIERDDNMISTFKQIFGDEADVKKADVLKQNLDFDETLDLVICSYVLSELNDADREMLFKKLLKIQTKYLLLIDTGTPKTYRDFMKLKQIAVSCGHKVIAPCMTEDCPLGEDYCQFYVRVERSGIHKMAKEGATLPYEDEKYFYLLLSSYANDDRRGKARVIRRPEISTNLTRLKLCTENGVIERLFSKRSKEEYRRAKKVKINDIF